MAGGTNPFENLENPTLLLQFWQTRTSRKSKVSLLSVLEGGVTLKRRALGSWVEGARVKDPNSPAMVALAVALSVLVEVHKANEVVEFVGAKDRYSFVRPKKGLPLCFYRETSGETTTDSWRVTIYETPKAFNDGCIAVGVAPPAKK